MLPPALRFADFRNYISGSFVSNVGNNVQAWAISWHIFQLTGSSLMVGLLGLVRVLPLLIFSLFGGVVADQYDRRKILLLSQSSMALISLGLFFHSIHGGTLVWPLYVMVALNAVARSFDGPARQAMMVGLVPVEHFPNAVSLNGVAWRLSDVMGPILTGVLIGSSGIGELTGISLCYAVNFLSFFALLFAVWKLSPRPTYSENRPQSFGDVISSIKEGLRFVKSTPVVRNAMWIDFWATLFSGAEALLPAFAGSILMLGPEGYGILASSTGFGALIAASVLTWRKTVHKQGKWVVWMIAAYGAFTIGFGLSPNLWTAAICLAGVGAADMISTVFRQTIRQLATPDEIRGRMNATSSLFHISGPQLGDFEAGAVANVAGERFSIVLGGSLCMLVAAWWSRAKDLTGYEHRQSK